MRISVWSSDVCASYLEIDRGVVIGEVIGHRLGGLFHRRRVGAFLQNHIAVPGMLLASGQAGQLAAAHAIYGVIHRYGVLHRSLHARYPAHGVGMPLAQALAPESICRTLWKNRLAEKPVTRKQAGIPPNPDQGHIPPQAPPPTPPN